MKRDRRKDMKKQAKDGQTEKYKQRIKRLEKEVRELKSKNKTLEAAFEKTGAGAQPFHQTNPGPRLRRAVKKLSH